METQVETDIQYGIFKNKDGTFTEVISSDTPDGALIYRIVNLVPRVRTLLLENYGIEKATKYIDDMLENNTNSDTLHDIIEQHVIDKYLSLVLASQVPGKVAIRVYGSVETDNLVGEIYVDKEREYTTIVYTCYSLAVQFGANAIAEQT